MNLAPFVYPQEPLFSSNIYWYAVREVINALQGPIAGDFAAAKHLYSSQAAANDDRTHHALHSHQLPSLFATNVRFSTLMTTGVGYFPQVHRVSWEKWGLADRVFRFCRESNIFIFSSICKKLFWMLNDLPLVLWLKHVVLRLLTDSHSLPLQMEFVQLS